MREEYRLRRDLVCERLRGCPGLQPIRPDGGMFVMVDVRQTGFARRHLPSGCWKVTGVGAGR
jgi:aspartate/methionine/tyrosine aminotransferase